MVGAPTAFPVRLEERDVRRLAGEATFARADAWQQAGHVLRPMVQGAMLSGEVRGTWRRVDRAQVTAKGTNLAPECSCGRPGLCPHAAALLLHWVRAGSSFTLALPAAGRAELDAMLHPFGDSDDNLFPLGGDDLADEDDADLDEDEDDGSPLVGPVEDMVGLLERFTVPQLREVARRRGLRLSAKSRDDLVQGLAPLLAAAEGVDAALAKLAGEERLAVQVLCLLGPQLALGDDLATAYAALGGPAGAPPVARLVELGLAAPPPRNDPSAGYAVPQTVASRVGPLAALATPRLAVTAPPAGAAPPAPALDVVQMLLAEVRDLQDHDVRPRPPAPEAAAMQGYLPAGWVLAPREEKARRMQRERRYYNGAARLEPAPPPLDDADLQRLAERTGQPAAVIAQVFQMALALGVVRPEARLSVDERLLQGLLMAPAVQRMGLLLEALEEAPAVAELQALVGAGGPLELHYQFDYYYGDRAVLTPQAAELRRLLIRTVAMLPAGHWYDPDDFLRALRRWVPFSAQDLAFAPPPAPGRRTWWLADPADPAHPVDLASDDGWQRVYGRFIRAVFAGSLSWLGLVEVEAGPDGPRAFRVRRAEVAAPTAGNGAAAPSAATLSVGDDLSIQVPAGYPDSAVYALLLTAGELAEVSAAGLRFRFTPERLREVFDAGVDGRTILEFLEQRCGGHVPSVARQTIEHWWAGYGRLRLYDDLTLIELADDYLLPELLATTSLRDALLHTFSPRLVAVDPAAAEELIAQLAKVGHPPRVVEGGR